MKIKSKKILSSVLALSMLLLTGINPALAANKPQDIAVEDSVSASVVNESEGFYQDSSNTNLYHITNLEGLKEFRDSVNSETNTYSEKTIQLDNDIDLNNEEWTPIKASNLTFDGENHTIKNLKVTTEDKNVGFFGTATSSTIKNLTIDGANVTGINHVAVISGDGLCGTFINCHVKNAVIETKVKNNDDGDKAGAIVGYLSCEPGGSVSNCSVENCTVTGYRDVGGIVGYVGAYSNTSKESSFVKNNILKNVTVVCDTSIDYKDYGINKVSYDANGVIGDQTSDADVKNCVEISDNTPENVPENVKVKYIPEVAEIGDNTYFSLQLAVKEATDGQTIKLLEDITLTGNGIDINSKNITIEGNGKTIKLGHTAFNHTGDNNAEGLLSGSLTVNNAKFEGTDQQGYVACLGFNSTYAVTLNNCTFKDMYTAVYANPRTTEVTEQGQKESITINECTYDNTTWGYSIDTYTGYDTGALAAEAQADVAFTGNTGLDNGHERESFETAQVGNKVYSSLDNAITNATSGQTIILFKDTEVTSQINVPEGVTIDGNNHKISANNANWSTDNGYKMLIQLGNNSQLKDITLDCNKQACGVQAYNVDGVVLDNVTITKSKNANLLINASTVTVKTALNLTEGGWGNYINLGWGSNVNRDSNKKCSVTFENMQSSGYGFTHIWTDSDDLKNAEVETSTIDNKFEVTDSNRDINKEIVDNGGVKYILNVRPIYNGGGGAAAPVEEEVTVPVQGDNTVNISAAVKNNTAEVKEITAENLDKITTGNTESINLDVSALDANGTTLTKTTVNNLSKVVADKTNKVETVEINLKNADIVLDSAALEAVNTQAQGDAVKLAVDNTKLNDKQTEALTGKTVAKTLDIYIESNGQRIHDFNGGSATVAVKFAPETGRDAKYYHVYYASTDGKLQKYATKYENGKLKFTTGHFSDYAIVYDESEENATYAHTHELTKVEAKAATADAEGNIEYYVCTKCGKYFYDAEGKNEITKESTVISKLNPPTVKVKAVKNLKVTAKGKTYVRVSWSKVSKVERYSVRVYRGEKRIAQNSTKNLTYKLTGLKKNTKYTIKVLAYNTQNGKKVYSNASEITVKTKK